MLRLCLVLALPIMLVAAPCRAQQKPLEARSSLLLRTAPPDSSRLPPVSAGRVAAQIGFGALGGGLIGFGGGIAGASLADCPNGRYLCGLGEAFIGVLLGYTLGSGFIVWAIGQSGEVTTSLPATLLGSMGGAFAVLMGAAIVPENGDRPVLTVLALLGPPVGATIVNAHTRRPRSGDASALVSVQGKRLRLGVPQPVMHRIRGARQTFGHGFRLLTVQW